MFTVEEMMPHIQYFERSTVRTYFLRTKEKGYWLVTVLHDRQINLNDLKQLVLGVENLRFADEAAMLEKLKAGPRLCHPVGTLL